MKNKSRAKITLRRALALVLALTASFTLFACSKKGSGKRGDYKGAEEAVTDAEINETPVIVTEYSTVTVSMFTYYFNTYYRTFVNKYAGYLSDWGLDTSKSLSGQKFQNDYDWHQYLITLCATEIKDTLALSDGAKADRLELDEDALADIDGAIDKFKEAAEQNGTTYEQYIKNVFGEAVNGATVEKCLRQQQLASVYYKVHRQEDPDDAACAEEYKKNPKNYQFYDCIKATVPEADAETLAGSADSTEFAERLRKIITDNNFGGNYDKSADTIESLLKSKYLYRTAKSDDDISAWAFEDGRKPYDVYRSEPNTREMVTVVMLLPSADGAVLYRDETPLKNFEYCFFENADKARSVYSSWVDGGADKDAFKALEDEYKGGTSTNVDRGDISGALADWLFSDSAVEGAHSVIDVDEVGTYILYVLADGEASWLSDVRAAIINKRAEDIVSSLSEKYPADMKDSIYDVKEVTITNSSNG